MFTEIRGPNLLRPGGGGHPFLSRKKCPFLVGRGPRVWYFIQSFSFTEFLKANPEIGFKEKEDKWEIYIEACGDENCTRTGIFFVDSDGQSEEDLTENRDRLHNMFMPKLSEFGGTMFTGKHSPGSEQNQIRFYFIYMF